MQLELLLLFLSDAQNDQSSGSVVDHHAVHQAASSRHVPSASASVYRTGPGQHLSSAPASTRRGPD